MRLLAASLFSLFAISSGFTLQPRIINGYPSSDAQFPFYVLLESEFGRCGASLLSDRWILTAAHCLRRKVEMGILFGSTADGIFVNGSLVPVANQHMHPLFDASSKNNDIGLLKLDTPIELNQYIQPVELSDVCDSPRMKGLPVTVAGTGRTTKEEPVSEDVLRYAQFTTMPSSSCVPYTNFKRASDSIICGFGNDTTEQVAHKGDSGGPLMMQSDGRQIGVQNGIVKFKHDEHIIQVFAHIPYYFDWIQRTTGLKLPQCDYSQDEDSLQ